MDVGTVCNAVSPKRCPIQKKRVKGSSDAALRGSFALGEGGVERVTSNSEESRNQACGNPRRF